MKAELYTNWPDESAISPDIFLECLTKEKRRNFLHVKHHKPFVDLNKDTFLTKGQPGRRWDTPQTTDRENRLHKAKIAMSSCTKQIAPL